MGEFDLLNGGYPYLGDAQLIRVTAQEFDRTALQAHEARMALDSIGSDMAGSPWEGETARKFQQAFGPLAPDLGLMAESYDAVQRALATYASQLEQLQQEVNQAVNRAQVAEQRRNTADGRRAQAAQRISDLGRQLDRVSRDQAYKEIEAASPMALVDPGYAQQTQQALQQAVVTKYNVEVAIYDAQIQQGAAERDFEVADGDLTQVRSWAGQLYGEWHDDQVRAAAAIEDALAQGLRNKSLIEKGMDGVAHAIDTLEHMKLNEIGAEFTKVVAAIHKVVDAISKVLADVALVLFVVGLIIPGPWTAVLALAILVIAAADFITGAYLYKVQYKEPGHDELMVSGWDVVSEGANTALAAFGARAALGELKAPAEAIAKGEIYVPKTPFQSDLEELQKFRDPNLSLGERAVHGITGYGDLYGNAQTARDVILDPTDPLHRAVKLQVEVDTAIPRAEFQIGKAIVTRTTQLFTQGIATPAVGGCYAN